MESQQKVPLEFFCPIRSTIMKDPVMGTDGHSYEAQAIFEWLSKNNFSPMTREPMKKQDLNKNHALRNIIEGFLAENPELATEVNPSALKLQVEEQKEVKVEQKKEIVKSNNTQIKVVVDTVSLKEDENLLNINFFPVAKGESPATVLIAVLDVSGSMDSEASANDGTGELQGFSRLDLVKHSMNTIVSTLEGKDYLSIVTFSDKANIVLPITIMNDGGKQKALDIITQLKTEGSTNIWDALRVSLELTKDQICKSNNTSLLLLTDGEPNVHPPMGQVQTLSMALQDFPNRDFSINTFGFGYSLDSKMLNDIASLGEGYFGYIPDCTMVGTIFVNFLANTLAIAHKRLTVQFESKELQEIFGNQKEINLGSVQFGQVRNISGWVPKHIQFDKDTMIPVTFQVDGVLSKGNFSAFGGQTDPAVRELSYDLFARKQILDVCDQLVEKRNLDKATAQFKILFGEFEKYPATKFIGSMIQDIDSPSDNEGQLTKGVSKPEWFKQWGLNFILSFVRCHILQICGNFKDQSIQAYGGELFQAIQNRANKEFCNLPPPAQSCVKRNNNNSNSQRAYSPPQMQHYMNYGGGCFDGNGQVTLESGKQKQIRELVKGDRVIANGKNQIATIECLVQTKINRKFDMYEIYGVQLTYWHPIRVVGQDQNWLFPLQKGIKRSNVIDSIFDVVLKEQNFCSILINDCVEAITLGHGRKDGILDHPYFGTEKVIEDLQKYQTWVDGRVVAENVEILRDEQGLIKKMF